MKKVVSAILVALFFVVCVFPTGIGAVGDKVSERGQGSGNLILDTDPSGGYEGDYVVIYNPATYSGSGKATGNMSGLIDTYIDPYASVNDTGSMEDVLYIRDVDAEIAAIDAQRPPVEQPSEAVRRSYAVGDIELFYISSYSPGSWNLEFKCVAVGEHCYVWTPIGTNDNYHPLDAIDETYPQIVADEFDLKYPEMNSSFGDHYNGSAGDGKVHLMYYNIDCGFQPGISNSYIAGYFSSYDFSSNGLPMIHIDTYPGVEYVNGNNETILRLENTFGTFCHEYQHLINYSQTGGVDTWLNEMMSAGAEEICYPGSSLYPRIQSWQNYMFADNEDWLYPPTEYEYTEAYDLHNGFSMYGWDQNLTYVLPLYAQVSLFSQYLFTHYGNTIFRQITEEYVWGGNVVNAIAAATGDDTSEIVKNFRIALTANDPVSYDGLYGFRMQEDYDPDKYYGVQNLYDLLAPIVFTGDSCMIYGGGAITVKPIGGAYLPPQNADSGLVYIGVTRNIVTEPVELVNMELSAEMLTTYVGKTTSVSVIRTPINANRYSVEWESSNQDIATVLGSNRAASITGVAVGTAVVTCTVTDSISGNTFIDSVEVAVSDFPTIDEAMNVAGGTLDFTTSGTYEWEVNIDFSDRVCANSGNRGVDSSSSAIETVINMEAGETLSFDWSVSSERNYDKLLFYVNGAEHSRISGSVNWTTYTFEAPSSGAYTFKWNYEKDGSVDDGNDTGYVDNVRYSGDNTGLLGDVDFDGTISVPDALVILRHALGLIYFSEEQIQLADVNGDGAINTNDAVLVLREALVL